MRKHNCLQGGTVLWLLVLFLILCFGGSLAEQAGETPDFQGEEDAFMRMMIGENPVEVEWEDNESVEALRVLAAEGLTIQMSMYGGFEQVGPVGSSLPRHDVQTTTSAGDIVLYSGNQIVVFYGSNSWAYTRLGRITDQTPEELRDLLGQGDVTILLEADACGD